MVVAYVMILVKVGTDKSVIQKLLALNGVVGAFSVYGDYDIIAHIEMDTLDELNSFVVNDLRNLDDVTLTNTLITI